MFHIHSSYIELAISAFLSCLKERNGYRIMSIKYENKIVLITGTSRGIGEFLMNYFLDEGAVVFGVSKGEVHKNNSSYIHNIGDVTKTKDVSNIIHNIRKNTGRLDIVINNAGIASMNSTILTPERVARKVFDVNFICTFNVSRESAKLMMAKKNGRIINFSSIAVPMNICGEAIYASSKIAVEEFTRIFSKEVAEYGITVNCVGPSPINTSMIENIPKSKIDKIIDNMSIKRWGEFKDVKNVVNFFCSDDSDYITGQTIYLGGVS